MLPPQQQWRDFDNLPSNTHTVDLLTSVATHSQPHQKTPHCGGVTNFHERKQSGSRPLWNFIIRGSPTSRVRRSSRYHSFCGYNRVTTIKNFFEEEPIEGRSIYLNHLKGAGMHPASMPWDPEQVTYRWEALYLPITKRLTQRWPKTPCKCHQTLENEASILLEEPHMGNLAGLRKLSSLPGMYLAEMDTKYSYDHTTMCWLSLHMSKRYN